MSMSGAANRRTGVVPVTGRSTKYSTTRRYGRVKDSAANKFARLASRETPCWKRPKAIDTSEMILRSTFGFQNQSKNILVFNLTDFLRKDKPIRCGWSDVHSAKVENYVTPCPLPIESKGSNPTVQFLV